jgi:hypothetical protein
MARASSKRLTPHPPERDDSHRSLLDKLGIKSGQAIAVPGLADMSFFEEISSRVPRFIRDAISRALVFDASRTALPRIGGSFAHQFLTRALARC